MSHSTPDISPCITTIIGTGSYVPERVLSNADLAKIAPYAVNVQFKVEINQEPGGKQPTDFARVVGLLRQANYQGYVTLEYEAEEDPWQAVPRHLKELRAAMSRS